MKHDCIVPIGHCCGHSLHARDRMRVIIAYPPP